MGGASSHCHVQVPQNSLDPLLHQPFLPKLYPQLLPIGPADYGQKSVWCLGMERSFLGVTAPVSEGLGPGNWYEKASGERLGPDPLYQPQAHQVGHWMDLPAAA